MKWFIKALNQYADFSGRARRTEYWMFTLINAIFAVVAMILDNIVGLTTGGQPYGVIYLIYALGMLIPGLAVAVRRLHDVGKSGWFLLIGLIPIVGSIWLIILMLTESTPGDNEYGPNPKNKDEEGVPVEEGTSSESIILFVVIWMLFTRLFWSIIPKIIGSDFYSQGWFEPVNAVMSIIWAGVPILLAFAVKPGSKRTAILVLGGIYFAYQGYEMVAMFL